jgi:hypothetical protein
LAAASSALIRPPALAGPSDPVFGSGMADGVSVAGAGLDGDRVFSIGVRARGDAEGIRLRGARPVSAARATRVRFSATSLRARCQVFRAVSSLAGSPSWFVKPSAANVRHSFGQMNFPPAASATSRLWCSTIKWNRLDLSSLCRTWLRIDLTPARFVFMCKGSRGSLRTLLRKIGELRFSLRVSPPLTRDSGGTGAGQCRDTRGTEAGQLRGSKGRYTPLHQWCGPSASRFGFSRLLFRS